jgi:transposase-like protein
MAGAIKPRISANTVREIIRQRLDGRPYKEIARALGVTPDQVMHYWRCSPFYPGINKETRWRRERARQVRKRALEARMKKKRLTELAEAKQELARQVEEARLAAPKATAHKRGPLEW